MRSDTSGDEGKGGSKWSRRSYLQAASGIGVGLSGISLTALGSETAQATTDGSLIDDFEDSDLAEYSFDRGASGASIVSTPTYAGSRALALSGTNTEMISTSGLPNYPEAGDVFKYRVRATGGADDINLSYGVQDHRNRYFVRVDFVNGDLMLYRYENGTSHNIASEFSFSLSQDTWYEVEIDWLSDGTHSVTLSNMAGDQIVQTSATDSTWTTGGVGYDAYLTSGETVYFDYVTLGSSPVARNPVIEDFEDGDLLEYAHDSSRPGRASVVSGPVHEGSSALELQDEDTELISTAGLDTYPSAGDRISYWVRPTSGAANFNVSWGVQDHDNRYYVKLRVDTNELHLFKYENESGTYLGGGDAVLGQDTWYKVQVDWRTDGNQTVRVFERGDAQVGSVSGTDSTWSSGGIGFDAYLDSGEAVNFDYVTTDGWLSGFENGFDGWTASGSNSLTRVSGDQEPASVTEGGKAIDVTVNSDPEPWIENELRVQDADFMNYPYLLADILPLSVENTDSPLNFRFGYHHTVSGGGVEASPEVTIDQQYGGVIGWDMSGLSDTKLGSPKKLELRWYPTEHPPSSGFDHSGQVLIDNIRLSESQDELTHAQFSQKQWDLERVHGPRIVQEIQSQSETTQDGVYRFSDGTEIPYTMNKSGNGELEETVDGDTFCWIGGSQ